MTGLRSASALLLLITMSGCALLRPSTPASLAVDGGDAPVNVTIDAPDNLRSLLNRHLDLTRLAVVAPGERVSEVELSRLIAAAPAQARALLETQGYFDATVTVQHQTPTGAQAAAMPSVTLKVEPGLRAQVARVDLLLEGELERGVQAGRADALALTQALRESWSLPVGRPFVNDDWGIAKSAFIAQMRAAGYFVASFSGTSAQVDATLHRARLTVVADSGPRFHAGVLNIEGLVLHDARTVQALAGFAPGAPASEAMLLDFQERLQRAGLFDRVAVSMDPDVELAAAAPLSVRVRELPLQQAVVGVGVSDQTGFRTSVDHRHRRVFGQALTARNKVELAQRRQAWEGELATHVRPGFQRYLVGGALTRVESDLDTVTSAHARLGHSVETPRRSGLAFVGFNRDTVTSASASELSSAVSLNYHATWRRVDNLLLPTEGYTLALEGGLGQARSAGVSGAFTRVHARLTGYERFGDDWYGQARLELGQVSVRNGVEVPDTLQFRAGGDESVRGYAYRSLAPTRLGVIGGGNVVFGASAEIARPVSKALPALWWAAFIDAGRAADQWSALKPAVGVGAGLRYRSPIGALRFDLAWGHEVQKLRIHLSVGVTY